VSFPILEPFEVTHNGTTFPLGRRRQRALLVLLAWSLTSAAPR